MIKLAPLAPTLHGMVFLASGVRAQSYVSNKRHGFALPPDQSPAPKPGIQGSPDLERAFLLSLPLQHYIHDGSDRMLRPPACVYVTVFHIQSCALHFFYWIFFFLNACPIKLFWEEMPIHPIFTQRHK